MRQRAIAVMILITFMMSTSILTLSIPIAKSTAIIRILSDGSVDPPTAPIHRSEDLYTFTDNIFASIIVERGNIIVDGNGFTVQGDGTGRGLDVPMKNNVTIKNTKVTGFNTGIYLNHSDGSTLSNNVVSFSIRYGIHLWFSSSNVLSNNSLTNNMFTINLGYCSDNLLIGNIVEDNYMGCWLCLSSTNVIFGNTFINNTYGIYNDYSWNNRIYNNNFIGNKRHYGYFDRPDKNFWDNGYPSGGNYWSDEYNGTDLYFGSNQTVAGSDGIGDTAHVIDKNNQDNYPLMGIFSYFSNSLGYNVSVVSNFIIEDFALFTSNSTIKMHVSNMTANQIHIFGRICIPSTLMSEPYNVIIYGAKSHPISYTLYENENSRYIYFSYEYLPAHHSLEIIIPWFLSIVSLLLSVIGVLLVVAIRRSKSKR